MPLCRQGHRTDNSDSILPLGGVFSGGGLSSWLLTVLSYYFLYFPVTFGHDLHGVQVSGQAEDCFSGYRLLVTSQRAVHAVDVDGGSRQAVYRKHAVEEADRQGLVGRYHLISGDAHVTSYIGDVVDVLRQYEGFVAVYHEGKGVGAEANLPFE